MSAIDDVVSYFSGTKTQAEAIASVEAATIWTPESVVYDPVTETYRNPYQDTASGRKATEAAILSGTSTTDSETYQKIIEKYSLPESQTTLTNIPTKIFGGIILMIIIIVIGFKYVFKGR